jgi:sec-independent protein translocase protein TatC
MSDETEAGTMTFWEHLEELRSRMLRMLIAFVVGGVVAWFFREKILVVLTKPFVDAWSAGHVGGIAALHFPAPASLFVEYVKVAALAGAVLALPIVLYQLWAFVAPGLYTREKRYAVPFVLSSCALFAGGAYFGYKTAFPVAFKFLLSFSGPVGLEGFEVKPTVMIGDYVDFVWRMFVAFGAVFELPVLVLFLSLAGVIDHTHLIKFSRYFIVIAFVIAAILTPPDVLSQFLLAIPLCLLYLISIALAWLVSRRRKAS